MNTATNVRTARAVDAMSDVVRFSFVWLVLEMLLDATKSK
jgi:hypothetical protein